ncbi:hypothetical protein MCAP1_001401 [Malassezia caprae]|uniref:Skg3/CAF120-like PH-like domain-containing protein n=1 Tax=Malassezia caprae TaxID=1381934 RepID=A0AAF0IW45_9BASI|nr:hypothetical protein MCAP1_001401 [Malassezia caprae]
MSARPLSAFQPLDGTSGARPQSHLFHAPPRLSMSLSGSNAQVTFKSIDLRNALQLHEALGRKLYMEGYLLVRHALAVDGQPDHRSDHFTSWTECFVQLSGTVLSFWEASALDRATAQGSEVAPTFMNITDAMVDYIGMHVDAPFSDPGKRRTLYHVFAINSAGSNRVMFCFPLPPPCDPTKVDQRLSPKNEQHPEHKPVVEWLQLGNRYLQSWINAVRLASWERLRLDEIYTGALIRARLSAVKGFEASDVSEIMVRSPLTKGRYESWVRARFMGSTEWRHCWMVLQSHWSEDSNLSGLRRFLRLGGAGDRSSRLLSDASPQMEPPTPPPGVLASPAVAQFYESKRSRQPFASLWHVQHVYALYPSRPDLVEDSVLFKAEGSLPQSQIVSATHRPRTSGWVMFMPDMAGSHGKVANAEMMKCIIAFMDAFRLYGRPDNFAWDPRNPISPFFAYPIGQYKNHLFLDRALTEFLDITVEDHLQSRQMLHDVMAARMRGENTSMLPPLPPIPRHSMYTHEEPDMPSDILSHEAQAHNVDESWNQPTVPAMPQDAIPLTTAEVSGAPDGNGAPADDRFNEAYTPMAAEPAHAAGAEQRATDLGVLPTEGPTAASMPTSSKRNKLTAGAFQSLVRMPPAPEPASLSQVPSSSNAAFDQAYREYDVPDRTPMSFSDDEAYFSRKSAATHVLQDVDPALAAAPSPMDTVAAPTVPPVDTQDTKPAETDTKPRENVTQTYPTNHRHEQIYAWPLPTSNEPKELSPIQEIPSSHTDTSATLPRASSARPLPQPRSPADASQSQTAKPSDTFASERPAIQVKVVSKPASRSSSGSRPLPIPGQAQAPPAAPASWPEVQPVPVDPKSTQRPQRPMICPPQVSPASHGSTPSPAIPSSLSFLAPSMPTPSGTAPASESSDVPAAPAGPSNSATEPAASRIVSGSTEGTESHLVSQYLDDEVVSHMAPRSIQPSVPAPSSSTVTALRPSPDTTEPEAPAVPAPEPQEDETWLYGAPDLEFPTEPLELHDPIKAEQEAAQAAEAASQEPLAYPSSFGRRAKQAQRASQSMMPSSSRPGRAPGAAPASSHDWADDDEDVGEGVAASPVRTPMSDLGASHLSLSPPAPESLSGARLSSYGNTSSLSSPSASATSFRAKNASSTSLGRTTFVKFDEPASSSQNPYMPHGLLASSPQDKHDRSTRMRDQGAREAGQTLVNVPSKPPPPQAGLMGAIHSRDRRAGQGEREGSAARPASMSASRSSQPHGLPGMSRSVSQQQMMMNMYYWQQQQMMMMMGMMPPGMPSMSRESMMAQQQAMQAAQQAFFQAYAQHTNMPMMPYPMPPDMFGMAPRDGAANSHRMSDSGAPPNGRLDSPPRMARPSSQTRL